MTVKELKALLGTLDDNDLIVLSEDGEGNGFSPLSDHSAKIYVPISSHSGEVHTRDFIHEDGQKAIVLWPIN